MDLVVLVGTQVNFEKQVDLENSGNAVWWHRGQQQLKEARVIQSVQLPGCAEALRGPQLDRHAPGAGRLFCHFLVPGTPGSPSFAQRTPGRPSGPALWLRAVQVHIDIYAENSRGRGSLGLCWLRCLAVARRYLVGLCSVSSDKVPGSFWVEEWWSWACWGVGLDLRDIFQVSFTLISLFGVSCWQFLGAFLLPRAVGCLEI